MHLVGELMQRWPRHPMYRPLVHRDGTDAAVEAEGPALLRLLRRLVRVKRRVEPARLGLADEDQDTALRSLNRPNTYGASASVIHPLFP